MALIPKTYAALSDALDEGSAHAARRVLEDIGARVSRALLSYPARLAQVEEILSDPAVFAVVADMIDTEVGNAIHERFDTVEVVKDPDPLS